jgi:probable rRNA maturation factor
MQHDIEVIAESPLWDVFLNEHDGEAHITRAALAAIAAVPFVKTALQVCICLDTDAAVQTLNKQFANKDKSTNVLSFGAFEDDEVQQMVATPQPHILPIGDIILAYQTCAQQAQLIERSFTMHISHLVVHGTLHVLGYDHILPADAALSESTERRIMAALGFDDPYPDSDEVCFP